MPRLTNTGSLYLHVSLLIAVFWFFRRKGAVNVFSLEKSINDLLSELRQTQTPLAFESDTDNLMGRSDPQTVQERVLHHNSELTNFVSRLMRRKWNYAIHLADWRKRFGDTGRGALNIRYVMLIHVKG